METTRFDQAFWRRGIVRLDLSSCFPRDRTSGKRVLQGNKDWDAEATPTDRWTIEFAGVGAASGLGMPSTEQVRHCDRCRGLKLAFGRLLVFDQAAGAHDVAGVGVVVEKIRFLLAAEHDP
ncbi:hypothetical protein Mal15_54920 [Stieleria maiorica]|uniref:Uncharacterized protein n=1 Tax=Stieleria maiorica TaxID=2795974 RepID=A0A5B9MP48_9BACT|nr:hypothetical protein Mal15_54920 [Stieleria maiorica]